MGMKHRKRPLRVVGSASVALLALASLLPAQEQPPTPETPPAAGGGPPLPAQSEVSRDRPYQILDGRVDEATFRGWQVFHSACHGCHGIDATGTAVAPNLVERIGELSAREFVQRVLTSYRITRPGDELPQDAPEEVRRRIVEEAIRRERGGIVMPAWEGTRVQAHVLDIYAYLRARGDGELLPGKPDQIRQQSTGRE